MPTSAPGAFRRGGFTLVELLVVLMIMGLFVGLVSTIVRPDERALLRVEAERLAQLLKLAATESRLTGKTLAWTADGAGYRFLEASRDARGFDYGSLQWNEIRGNELLRSRTLPNGMTIARLEVEDLPSPGAMRLEFTPYRPGFSFRIKLLLGERHFTVLSSPIGEVRVAPGEEGQNG